MNDSAQSNCESSFSEISIVTDVETETHSAMKKMNEELDKELDEDLVSAFNDFSRNEDKSVDGSESEDDDHRERNVHSDSSVASEGDISSEICTANPNLHQKTNSEFENELLKENLCDGYEETSQNKLEDSDSQLKNNKLKEEIQFLKLRLLSLIEMNQFLENQLCELNTADHLPREDHDKIVQEMKLWFESDILVYKENVDKLQSELNLKLKEAQKLALENSELRRKNQQLQIEKDNWANKISEEILAQRKCQLFLESGTIEEINRLKLQVRHLEEENSLLKESFFQRWTHTLLRWQFRFIRRVLYSIGLPIF